MPFLAKSSSEFFLYFTRKRKNCDISATVWRISTKFKSVMQNVSVHTQLLKFQLQKSKMADSRNLENRKIAIS